MNDTCRIAEDATRQSPTLDLRERSDPWL